jgi:hypothetical protein
MCKGRFLNRFWILRLGFSSQAFHVGTQLAKFLLHSKLAQYHRKDATRQSDVAFCSRILNKTRQFLRQILGQKLLKYHNIGPLSDRKFFAYAPLTSRLARFFLAQYTKTAENLST